MRKWDHSFIVSLSVAASLAKSRKGVQHAIDTIEMHANCWATFIHSYIKSDSVRKGADNTYIVVNSSKKSGISP